MKDVDVWFELDVQISQPERRGMAEPYNTFTSSAIAEPDRVHDRADIV
jgi:hypothetical protein